MAITARLRPEGDAAPHVLGGARGALTCAAGSLLLEGLASPARDERAVLHRVRSAALGGVLAHDHGLHQIRSDRRFEDRLVDLFESRPLRAADGTFYRGLALADAETSFWTASEPSFLDWLATVTAVDTWTDEADALVEAARQTMHMAVRRAAQALFDAHVSLFEFDPRKQELVAIARRRLIRNLYPNTATASLAVPSVAEVTT